MKTLDKREMQERNKVHRVLTEVKILRSVDHPFVATLYCVIQVSGLYACIALSSVLRKKM
jgi:serine/threonine protein kinase